MSLSMDRLSTEYQGRGIGAADEELSLGEALEQNPYMRIKIAGEWLGALALLIVASPVLALLALAVKLTSPGPVFYRQVRLGLHGRPFSIYKLRSMTHNCEAKTGATWARPNDSRCTPLGMFMRVTHLDELPQLINVLRGEMSLIGPRPERPELVAQIEELVPRYRHRLLVRPGLTGLAQVELPADTAMDDVRHKLAYDLYYVAHLGPGMDARVIACTGFHVVGLALNAVGQLLVKRFHVQVEKDFQSQSGRRLMSEAKPKSMEAA